MKNRFAIAILLAVVAFLAREQARAQGVPQPIYDVACPAGSTSLGQTPNPATGHLKAYLCVDSQGNVTSPTLGGSACIGANCFSPTNYPGWHGDGQESVLATWAGGGATLITCPNCNFTPSDSGKLCWAIPNVMTVGPTAPGTFTYLTSTTGSCTASAIIGSASGNGVFEWGHDDYPAWVAAEVAVFTQPKGGSLYVPSARSMVSGGLSFLLPAASDFSLNVIGFGYDAVIVPEPGFNFAGNTNNIGCLSTGNNQGCFFNFNNSNGVEPAAYLYWTVSGSNQIVPGGCPSGIPSQMFTLGAGSYAIGVNLFDWQANGCAPKGAYILAVGPFGLGFATTNWFDGNIWCNGAACLGENNGGNATLKTSGGNMYDLFGTYGGMYTTGAGSALHGFGSQSAANSGSFGSSSCDHNGGETVFLEQGVVGWGTPGTNGIGFQFNSTGSGAQCSLYSFMSNFNGGASGSSLKSQAAGIGNWVDFGGNGFAGPVNFQGTYSNMTALNVFGACTGVVTASSTLGLYGTGPNVTATTCTSTTVGTGILMNKNATVYELLATSTVAGVNASSGAVTVLKNGAAQTMTCTMGTGTACQDGTHTFTVVPGDLVSIRFTSQAADTLAGVKATLVID